MQLQEALTPSGLALVRVWLQLGSGLINWQISGAPQSQESNVGRINSREASPGPNPTSLTRSFMTSLNRVAKGLWRVEDKFGLKFTCKKTKLTHVQQEGLTHPAGGLQLNSSVHTHIHIPVAIPVAVTMYMHIYQFIYAATSV